MVIVGQTGREVDYGQYTGAVFTKDGINTKNYLIKPGDEALCVMSEDRHTIGSMHYGMIPFWSNTERCFAEAPIEGNRIPQPHVPLKKRLIHDPAFRKAIRRYRLIVPVNYFILCENQQAYLFFHHEFSLFSLAGLYDYPLSLSRIETVKPGFALLTWPAYGIFKSVGFSRVPFVLPVNRHKTWIRDGISLFEVTRMMVPYDDASINACALDAIKVMAGENSRESIRPAGKRLKPDHACEHPQAVRSSLREYRRQRHEIKKSKAGENTSLWRNTGQ